MYHTQEKWARKLSNPIATTNKHAWLGNAYYFWYSEEDSVFWGITAKKNTSYYEVYKAQIDCDNVLDTVFNESHYHIWVKNVEKALQILVKDGKNVTLREINNFFKAKGIYDGIDGVMFQDITNNRGYWIVDKFQYKKRIQLAAYNLQIISNFTFYFESEC